MKYLYITFVYWLALCGSMAYAQQINEATITGKIKDKQLNPLSDLTVLLLSTDDSTQVQQVLTNPAGAFTFNAMPGNYFVKVSGVGYKTYISSSIQTRRAGEQVVVTDIILEQQSNELQEVIITQKANPLEMINGKLVYNIAQSAAATGASALELLQRTPGVSLDQNENVLLKGSPSVNILIDGKTAYLSSSQLSNMLKGMNSSNISRIEVINNPSAQYDASGNAGVINIITKKSNKEGYALDFSTGVGAGHYFFHRESIAGNIKNKLFNIFGNVGYDRRHSLSLRTGQQLRQINSQALSYQREIADEMQTHYYTYRLGIDFYVNKKTEIGLVYNGYTDDWSRNAGGPTRIIDQAGIIQSTIQNRNVIKEPYYNNGFNLNFKTKLDTSGKTLTANADLISYKNNSDGFIGNLWKDQNGNDLQPYQQLNFHQPSNIDIRSLKADLELPYKKVRILSGLKYSSVTIDNNFRYDSLINNNYVYAPSLSDHFVYKEQIAAAYVSAEKKWNKTIITTGLRVENTLSDANSISTKTQNIFRYTDLFPSLLIEQSLSEAHKISLSLSRRIDRPVYSNLNPVRYFSDKYAYSEGNPNLRPEKAWISSLSYSLKSKYIATLSYSRTNNFISQSAVLDNSTGILITSQQNFPHRDLVDLLFVVPINITSFWSSTNTLDFNFTKYPLLEPQGLRSVQKTAVDMISNHTFDLPGKSVFEIMAHYTSSTLNGVYIRDYFFSVDGGFKKSLFNNKLDARLAFSDLFKTIRYQGYTITNTANNQYTSIPDSRRFNFTLIYHIGGRLNRGKTQNIEEQQRL